jgi:hypothetical protein
MRTDEKLGADAAFPIPRERLKTPESRKGVLLRVERERDLVLAVTVTGGVLGILFHQVRGIGKKERAQFTSRIVSQNGAAIAAVHQARKIAGVIQMGMRQHNPIDGVRVHRQMRPVSQPQVLSALKQAAIDQESAAAGLYEIF